MKPRAIYGLSLLVVALLATMASAQSWEQQFRTGIASTDSNVRADAIRVVDPNTDAGREALYRVLRGMAWYERWTAVQVLSQTTDPEALDQLREDLGRRATNNLVREGIALALGLKNDPQFAPVLIEALGDRDPMVRRAASISLRYTPSREGVTALIDAWADEDEFQIWVHMKASLELITGRYFGNVVQDWRNWWATAQNTFVPGQQDEEAQRRAQQEGLAPESQSTVVRGVHIDYTEVGQGPPLFVIPEYGYSKLYLETHLLSLADICRVFFIELPGAVDFPQDQLEASPIPNTPYYPIDLLVDALDELRANYHQEKVAILGHGFSGWIAMRYASRHPEHCSHLILVSSYANNRSYGQALDRVVAAGREQNDPEMEHWAQSNQFNGQDFEYRPTSEQEATALARREFTLHFNTPQDLFLSMIWENIRRPMGSVCIPDFDCNQEEVANVPTMVMVGRETLLTDVQDSQELAEHFPVHEMVVCRNSARMPFIEENEFFTRAIQAFFRAYPFREGRQQGGRPR